MFVGTKEYQTKPTSLNPNKSPISIKEYGKLNKLEKVHASSYSFSGQPSQTHSSSVLTKKDPIETHILTPKPKL